MNQDIAIGSDVGGSHISCAAVDLKSGRVLSETSSERAVNNQAHAAEIISVWSSCLREAMEKSGTGIVRGIGFAMPGPFDYVNGISYIKGVSKYENLYCINIGDAILSSLDVEGEMEIRFMNDASSFAVGEAWGGKAADFHKSMCITLGTGLGSAFIEDKIPVVDGPSVPRTGCVYHLPYKDSIADDYFTTRWFLGRYWEATGKELSGVKELANLVSGDSLVKDLFHEFAVNLGIFLAPWLMKFGAEILVAGGNISQAFDIFGEDFRDSLRNECWTGDVILSEMKENAAIVGSACLFNENFWKEVQHALPLM